MTIVIRRLGPADAEAYWTTRIRALTEHPDAFTTTPEECRAVGPEKLATRFGGPDSDDFTFGAFDADGRMLGYCGFEREGRQKLRHKGKVIGMYVTAETRGTGLGRRLLLAVLEDARRLPGLEQIGISVSHDNVAARQLYAKTGFVTYGIEPRAVKIGASYSDKELMLLRLRGD